MKKHFCGRCGFTLQKTQRLHSRHTDTYYCTDIDECGRRFAGELTYEEISNLANKVRANI